MTRRVLILVIALMGTIGPLLAQNTVIPDANFEQALIDLNIDSDGMINGLVLTSDIDTIAELSVFNRDIADLTGIQSFSSLEQFNCSGNRLSTIDLSGNTNLINLNASSNQLTVLDIGINTSLVVLNLQDNQLQSLNITSNTALEEVNFTNNQIINIDLTANSAITSLKCASNRLASLDVSGMPQLEELICSTNQLNAINVSNNVGLKNLLCASNNLTGIDVAANTSLLFLDCSDNQISMLDVTTNRELQQLTTSANQLSNLDVSQNDSLTLLAFANNQLSNIDVGANLKLENFVCASNLLTTLNTENNASLRSVDFSFNLIESVNFDVNDSLQSVNGSNNRLQAISIQNGNNAILSTFSVVNNPELTCINIDNDMEIGSAWLKDASANYATDCDPLLTAIPDPNFEQALIGLGLDIAPIDGFVITDSINKLVNLDVSLQNIMDLTGIEDFASLAVLNCSNNVIVNLDLTKNSSLTGLDCSSNALVSLIVKNNNNASLVNFDARNNPSLTCIAVDDASQIGAMWQKDAGASYADNCVAVSTFIPDDNFEQLLIDRGIDTGPLDNYVLTSAISGITMLDVSGENIENLTGIEGFAALTTLDCSSNLLFELDVSQNLSLTNLICFNNYLSQLDVAINTSLVALNCSNNRLSQLDVSTNTTLEELIVDSNFLTSLDLSANSNLQILNCNSNNLPDGGLNLASNTGLLELFCSDNNFVNLDVTQNAMLTKLDISGNRLSMIDLTQNGGLQDLDASSNFIVSIDLTANTALDTLNVSSNLLQALSLTNNIALRLINAENNQLMSMDLSTNSMLETLFLASNEVMTLDLTNNSMLSILDVDKNRLATLDVSGNLNLLSLSCANNFLPALDLTSSVSLVSLNFDDNDLMNIDISANADLESLSFSRNSLSTIDVSSNPLLANLSADNNQLTALDLTNNAEIQLLSLTGNAITALDLTLQTKLISLAVSSNELTSLNLKNGNNVNLEVLNALDNPELLCIEVDDENNIGSSWRVDAIASFSENCHYNDTFIPDDNFESVLSVITGEIDNNDDYILTASISGLGVLDVSNSGITDLTGIEDFLDLEELNASNNSLDSVYLNQLTNLRILNVSGNNLSNLDLVDNKLLANIDISSNQIAQLKTDSLTVMSVFNANDNLISELIFDNNSLLTALTAANNQLEILSIQNGANNGLTTLEVSSNPNLTCIQVDDVNNIGSAWVIDATASYSENCHYNETFVPDVAFEQALIDLGLDETSTGPLDNYIPTSRAMAATVLNISNYGITDLTGLQDFVNLTNLNCSSNDLTLLNLDNNLNLEVIDCSNNKLSEIDVSIADSLRILDISGNSIGVLDVTQNTALRILRFSSNNLIGLDITRNTRLTTVVGQVNSLFSIDANNGQNEDISSFDLRNNPNLTCILVDNIDSANVYTGWFKDSQAEYKLICDDDDNDGVPDVDDVCPGTPFGSQVDLFGCALFSLPTDNFTVLTTSESCRGGNNGMINITAKEILAYTATLTSELDSITSYEFGDQVEIRNVRAGSYKLCITVADKAGYEQCYTLIITEPEDLKVLSSGRRTNGRVSYQMSGSDSYIIEFNGRKFETAESEITLTLLKGQNMIRIKTKLDCQGLFEENFFFSEDIFPFPNPFNHTLNIGLNDQWSDNVQVNIYSISGKLQYSENIGASEEGLEGIDTSEFTAGVYILELVGEDEIKTFKIVKK